MRDKWHGDNRDLVKWGVLLTLAERFAAKHILQVLYHRPTTWPELEIDGERVALPKPITEHFRRAITVSAMECRVVIEVVANSFPESIAERRNYQQIVIDRIRSRPPDELPGVVFLDPDTGLEPLGSSGPEHVLKTELHELWRILRSGDVLVLYQHQTNQAGRPWIEPKKAEFEQALGIGSGTAKIARAEKIARDVAFFYTQRDP